MPTTERPVYLTREQIDTVIDAMTAADIIEVMGDGTQVQGAKMVGEAFNVAAKRLGLANGVAATASIRLSDFQYLATRIGEVVNIDSPLSEGIES